MRFHKKQKGIFHCYSSYIHCLNIFSAWLVNKLTGTLSIRSISWSAEKNQSVWRLIKCISINEPAQDCNHRFEKSQLHCKILYLSVGDQFDQNFLRAKLKSQVSLPSGGTTEDAYLLYLLRGETSFPVATWRGENVSMFCTSTSAVRMDQTRPQNPNKQIPVDFWD